jgi:hypothetical protein
MAALIGDLIVGIFEFLLWALLELLPVVCYFTAIVLVFAVTLGRVTVEYPKNSANSYWSWRKVVQGRTILSPALGTIIGFSFWAIVVALTIIVYQYWHA